MFNNRIGENKDLGRFLFCERYTLPPVKNAMYIAEGQELKRGAVVDVNGVLVGTNSLMPYAVLEFDCDTRDGGKQASVFVKGEFNFDKLTFASGLSTSDLDNIVYNGNGLGIVIKPYVYEKNFIPEDDIVYGGSKTNSDLVEGVLTIENQNSWTTLTLDDGTTTLTIKANAGIPNFALTLDNSANDSGLAIVVKDSNETNTLKHSSVAGTIVAANTIAQITAVGDCWAFTYFED